MKADWWSIHYLGICKCETTRSLRIALVSPMPARHEFRCHIRIYIRLISLQIVLHDFLAHYKELDDTADQTYMACQKSINAAQLDDKDAVPRSSNIIMSDKQFSIG